MPDTYPRLVELISGVTETPASEISAEARFESLGDWTSYSALRLLTLIEERFAVRLDLRTYMALHDVAGLVDAVDAQLGTAP
jgi:acyl carrier protein